LGELPTRAGYGLAADDTAVWVYNGETGNLLRIDPATNRIVATISVEQGCDVTCGSVAIGQGAVWVAAGDPSKVLRIDPQTNQVVATIPLPQVGGLIGLFVTPGVVWVTDYEDNAILRIDPATNKMVATLFHQPGPTGVTFGSGSLWQCNAHTAGAGLLRRNPTTMQVQAQIDVSDSQGLVCSGLIALDQAVWVAATDGTTSVLERIAPATNQVAVTIPIPGTHGSGVAMDAQGEWLLDTQRGLSRLAPSSGQLVGVLPLLGGVGLTLGAGSVWIAMYDGTLVRVTPAS
jgi:DNA-binding beta-propeller fold protein YncE